MALTISNINNIFESLRYINDRIQKAFEKTRPGIKYPYFREYKTFENAHILHLIVEDTEIDFMKKLRNILLTQIPSLRITYIRVRMNESNTKDECIGDSLSMIPIYVTNNTNTTNYNSNKEIKSTNNMHYMESIIPGDIELEFECDIQCPKSEVYINVYASDVKCTDPRYNAMFVHGDGIIICVLESGKSLKFTCTAVVGSGNTNARYSAVLNSVVARIIPKIKVRDSTFIASDTTIELLKKTCPQDIFDIETLPFTQKGYVKVSQNNTLDNMIRITKRLNDEYCTMCRRCLDWNSYSENIDGRALPTIKVEPELKQEDGLDKVVSLNTSIENTPISSHILFFETHENIFATDVLLLAIYILLLDYI